MTPPPAESVAAMIRSAPMPPDSKTNRDLLAVMKGASSGYWLLLGLALLFMYLAGGIWVYQVYKGLGIAGYAHPVFWGVYIVTFVFWVGIAHAGTLISAILYLFRAKWRNAINRGAEAMTAPNRSPVRMTAGRIFCEISVASNSSLGVRQTSHPPQLASSHVSPKYSSRNLRWQV